MVIVQVQHWFQKTQLQNRVLVDGRILRESEFCIADCHLIHSSYNRKTSKSLTIRISSNVVVVVVLRILLLSRTSVLTSIFPRATILEPGWTYIVLRMKTRLFIVSLSTSMSSIVKRIFPLGVELLITFYRTISLNNASKIVNFFISLRLN